MSRPDASSRPAEAAWYNVPMSDSIEWKAPEYSYRERSGDWFWAVGIIAASLAVTAVLLGDALFAVVILIAAFTLAMYAKRKPRLVKFEVGERSIRAGQSSYPYATLAAFWVEEFTSPPKLIFKSKKITMPHIILPIDAETVSPPALRQFLAKRLPEEEMMEPLSLKIMEYLGF